MANVKEKTWYGWKDIEIDKRLIGDVQEKGSGLWQKKYRQINIPDGYGYDNYSFLLSDNCIHISEQKHDFSYFSIADNMNIELIYDPEKREVGKRYKRYKKTGYELFEEIFKDYEYDFQKESLLQLDKERKAREKRERKIIGSIVCGMYTGNIYANPNNGYYSEDTYHVYFKSEAGTYRNKKFSKVQNIKYGFTIISDVSLYFFNEYEDILNNFVLDYDLLVKEKIIMERRMQNKEIYPVINSYSKDIMEEHYNHCLKTIEDIKNNIKNYSQEKFQNQP